MLPKPKPAATAGQRLVKHNQKQKNATRRANNRMFVCNTARSANNKGSSVNRFIEPAVVLIKPTSIITMYIHIDILDAGKQASSR